MSFKSEGRFYRGKGDYAGRFDTLAQMSGSFQGVVFDGQYVLDYKSSKDPKKYHPRGYPEWRLQTAAYRDGARQTLDIVADGNATIRLDKFTGLPDIFDSSDTYTQDLVCFQNLVRFYHSMYPERLKKGAPSVTTILDVLDKPALVQWAANTTADYVWEYTRDRASLSRVELGEMLADAKKNWRKLKKDAADIGTEVHRLIEDFLKTGDLPHMPSMNIRVERAFSAFLEFYEAVEMKVILQEVNIYGSVGG